MSFLDSVLTGVFLGPHWLTDSGTPSGGNIGCGSEDNPYPPASPILVMSNKDAGWTQHVSVFLTGAPLPGEEAKS